MRGRVAVLLLSIPLIFEAQAQCTWTPRFSGQFRTTALDLSIDGNFIWLATGYGVQLLERGVNGTPTILDSVAIPGNTRVVRADGNGLAYAGSGSRVYVLRRDGKNIQVVRFVAASATVNDMAVSSHLFVATTNGIDHFDRIDPQNPTKTSAFLSTTAPNVTSLAIHGASLYAADGDATLEVFNISVPSLPQNVARLESVRATSVHTTADGFVLASDNVRRNTDLFSGTSHLARMPFATTSFAPSTQGHFVAGPDRTLLAVDISNASRVAKLFEVQLPPTDGSDNSIHAIERSGNTLYVAAGDIGLVMLDVSTIARPFPVVSYSAGAMTSVRAAGDKVWFAGAEGTISEQRIVTTGLSLLEERSWSGGAGAIVRDVAGQTLLTSTGSSVSLWSLAASIPTTNTTITFADSVIAAAIRGSGVVALLANGSVWTAQAGASPSRLNVPRIAALARNASAFALVEINEATGKTTLHHYANGDFNAEPRRITFDGAAVGNIALDATRAAVFTFTGINLIDLGAGTSSIIADSRRIIPRHLALSAGDLIAVDGRTLLVYDDSRTLAREHSLPANTVALDASGQTAVMATSEGTAAAMFFGQLPQPTLPFRSSFYSDIAAGSDRVYLLNDDGVDLFGTGTNGGLQFINGIHAQGLIDVAASATRVFTLGANGMVTAYTPAGVAIAQVLIDEGVDAQPRAIATVGNAVWLSISKGCSSSGACEKKTLVLDAGSLAVTATMTGGVDDVVTSGTRAYALVDTPREIRVLNIADPLHPSLVVSTARPTSGTSITAAGGRVYVLGDKVYAFAENTLTANGDFLSAVAPNELLRIRAEGNCAVTSGRSENVESYRLPNFAADGTPVEMPSAVRSFVVQPGRLIYLTAHSVELWSTIAPETPPRRRSVR